MTLTKIIEVAIEVERSPEGVYHANRACHRAVREACELLAAEAEQQQWVITEKGKRRSKQIADGIREIAAELLERVNE